MQQLPPSEYIFPDPLEVDPEGEGLICIGAVAMVSFHGSPQVNPFAGGALNHVASSDRRIISPVKPYFVA